MGSTRSEVEAFYDGLFDAIHAKDLDRLMAGYSPEVVYFDVVPPLRFAGSAALRARFAAWFAGFHGPIAMEARDFEVSTSGDIAVAHWFSRARGTLTDGRDVGTWVRATSCARRTDHGWLVTHEHISLPADLATGRAVADLVP
jgi:ketosteroid isomerase-like protein